MSAAGQERVVYRGLTQAELDRAYDQRAWAPDMAEILAAYGEASAAVRLAHAHRADLAYGPSPVERLDWFVPGEPMDGAIHLHIHGGAWRALSKHDVAYPAPAFLAAGVHFVVPDFVLLPAGHMTEMVAQLVRAIGFVRAEAPALGADPDRIFLSGHSSGAHLAAVLATLDWERHGLPRNVIKGCLCISGLYDLEPVLLSARAAYVRLDGSDARALSPVHHLDRICRPFALAHGGLESPEFIRQAQHLSEALTAAGTPHDLIVEPDANHFTIANDLGRRGAAIHEAALRQIRQAR